MIIVQIRPVRNAPKWWPRNGKETAWASLGKSGFSVGLWEDYAVRLKKTAINLAVRFVEGQNEAFDELYDDKPPRWARRPSWEVRFWKMVR